MSRPTIIQQQMNRIAKTIGKKGPAKAAGAARGGRSAPNVIALPGGRRAIQITPEMVALAKRKPRRNGEVPQEFNPFRFPTFPKGAIPSDGGMAKDTALVDVSTFGGSEWTAAAGTWAYNQAFFEGVTFLGYTYLAQLAQRPEYRKISERIATDMTRKWIKLQATSTTQQDKGGAKASDVGANAGEDPQAAGRQAKKEADKGVVDKAKAKRIKVIEDEMKRLKVRDRFREIAEQDGFFGRSHLYLKFARDDAAGPDELQSSVGDGRSGATAIKVNRKNPLVELRTVEPVWCYPMQYNSNNPLAPDWYRPQMWNVMGQMVHRSRIIPFVGREVPDMLKPSYAFGGLALSQMAKPYVDNWLRTRQSVSDLVHSFSISGLKTDMSQTTTPQGNLLFNRLDMFNLLRDNRGVFAIDKNNEEFFQFNTPLGTLDALQAQAMEQMAAVVNMPLVILLGISPHGLNASSEGEIRVYYDWIEAYQEKLFADRLTTIIDFIQLSKFGDIDPEVTFKFQPLWSMTEKEAAEVDKAHAEADQIRIDSGVIHPVEARARIAADPASPYTSLDVDDVPEPPAENDDTGGGEPGEEDPDGGGGPGGKAPFGGASDSWNEGDHPRGEGGKFTSGAGGGAASALSETDAKWVREYQSGSSVNGHLRDATDPGASEIAKGVAGQKLGESYAKQQIESLDRAIGGSVLTRNTTLYRGIPANAVIPPAGETFVDPAFASTSTKSDIAGGFVGGGKYSKAGQVLEDLED